MNVVPFGKNTNVTENVPYVMVMTRRGELNCRKIDHKVITRQMEHIMANFSNANSTVEIVGRTAAYNDIVLIKITEKNQEDGPAFRAEEDKYIVDKPEKKIIFIVHGLNILGIHNLQCLSNVTEFSTLVSYYLEHLDKFDIFLIPLANPDGYARKELFWNKNISPQAACPGVSLDRNFDVAWNTSKSISSCSPIYAGSNPFSEPEARAVRDVLHHFSHKIIAYIHVHAGSYDEHTYKGEAVLYPKGYTDAQTDDDKYLDLRGEIDEAMKNASFKITSVTVDTLYNWYGKVSGSSVDYASTIYGIPYALEFVMQLYTKAILQRIALKEIWKRMVDVVFNNIWKSINANEVK
nr:M14 metal carboxypeptidase-like 20 [Antheraea pernyi]